MAEASIKVPDELIQDIVRGDIAKQLAARSDLMETVIRTILEHKSTDYPNRNKTYFQVAFEDMVKETAKSVFGEWLEENRDQVRKTLVRHLTKNRSRALEAIAASMAKRLTEYSVSVDFKLWQD